MAENTVNNKEDVDLESIFETSHPELMLRQARPFMELMMHYECALHEIETKLTVLNSEFSLTYNRNPIETIKTRIKKPVSIINKLRRKGYPLSLSSIEKNLSDIAGIRVICSFQDDIYNLAEILARQDDIVVVSIKDYIKDPKPNGYRSLHMIIEIPIFLSNMKKNVRVEIQFRTIAMDFWASLEHTLKYKKQIDNPEEIASRLSVCAEIINKVDTHMLDIRNMIDEFSANGGTDE